MIFCRDTTTLKQLCDHLVFFWSVFTMLSLYSEGLYDVLTQDEFVTLCHELKSNNDKIGTLKVLRHQFDLSLHAAKVETENLFDGADPHKIYDELSKGVLRKPDEKTFTDVCDLLRKNGAMGTLQRLISKYTNANGETFSKLNELDFSSLELKDELTYPFRYDD